MEEGQGRAGNTAIIVALITVFGAIATGVITNWEKIFGPSSAAPTPVVIPAKTDPARPANTVAELDSGPTATASKSAGLADPDVAAQTATASAPNISGDWSVAASGTFVRMAQQGGQFAYQQFANGVVVGNGSGEIHGRSLIYQFRFTDGQVTIGGPCEGTLQTANLIVGHCYPVNSPPFPFQMAR